jgi:hypothetical protein
VQSQTSPTPETEKPKKRHGCLAAWLYLSIIFNVVFTVLYLAGAGVSESTKTSPTWAIPILILLLICEIVCILALLSWKKWGFWGFCAINLIGLIVDIGLGINMIWPSIDVLVNIAILFGMLNIGQDDKGWPQLD